MGRLRERERVEGQCKRGWEDEQATRGKREERKGTHRRIVGSMGVGIGG